MTAAETLIALYQNALREIVETLGRGDPNVAQIALEIAADALADGDDA